jgi:hypothetical protein
VALRAGGGGVRGGVQRPAGRPAGGVVPPRGAVPLSPYDRIDYMYTDSMIKGGGGGGGTTPRDGEAVRRR